jgi:hypothetical protein
MKRLTVVLGLILAGCVTGCLQKTADNPGSQFGALLRWQWVGSARLAQDPSAAKLRTIGAIPASAELQDQILQKLARAPHAFWLKDLPPGGSDQAALIRPLLDDLITSESFLEVRGPVEKPHAVLAVQLGDDRAGLWDKNLGQVMQGWKLGVRQPCTIEGFKGWEVKRNDAPTVLRFIRARNWVLVSLGPDGSPSLPTLLRQVSQTGRPAAALQNAWLDLRADAPGLRRWFPVLASYSLPPIHLTVAGKGENLRTEARFYYSDKIPWTFEPWRIPTNAIRDPIVSFTAGQGIAPLLNEIRGISSLGLSALPNQFCMWAQPAVFAQTYGAMPVANATNTLRQLSQSLPKFIHAHLSNPMGQFGYVSNRHELVWQGLPLAAPKLDPLRDSGSQFVVGGLFPPTPGSNRAPAELFAQLGGRKNLLYYDWEITQERLTHARPLFQLWDIINRRQFTSTNAPSQKWMRAVAPLLGNTVTEVTLTSPKELALVRSSHLGFTGFELCALSRWIDSPGFPFKFEPPPPLPSVPSKGATRTTNAVNRPKR